MYLSTYRCSIVYDYRGSNTFGAFGVLTWQNVYGKLKSVAKTNSATQGTFTDRARHNTEAVISINHSREPDPLSVVLENHITTLTIQ